MKEKLQHFSEYKTRKRLTYIFWPFLLLVFFSHMLVVVKKPPTIVIQNENKTHIGEQDEYMLIATIENATEVLVNWVSVEITDWKIEQNYDLENKATQTFDILAKNEKDEVKTSFTITRDLTQVELAYQTEQQAKQEELKKQKELEREEKKRQQAIQRIADQKQQTDVYISSLNSFDPYNLWWVPLVLLAKVREFWQIAQFSKSIINSDDAELAQKGRQLQSILKSVQQKSFPIFRSKYADYIDTLMRENNIDAKASGGYKDTLDLVWLWFANNKNIAQVHEEIIDVLILLRFERVNYKRSEYSEYQYFDVDSLSDWEI